MVRAVAGFIESQGAGSRLLKSAHTAANAEETSVEANAWKERAFEDDLSSEANTTNAAGLLAEVKGW